MKVTIVFTTTRVRNGNMFGVEFQEDWKLNESPWNSTNKINDDERRLIVYDGYNIYSKINSCGKRKNEDYSEDISKKITSIIQNIDAEFLILLHFTSNYKQNIKDNLNMYSSKKIFVTMYSKSDLRFKKFILPLANCTNKLISNNDKINDWQDKFDKLWNDCVKDIKKEILRIFLPMDIDMQALKILWDKDIKEALQYFKEMIKDTEDNFYKNKLNFCHDKAKEFIDQIADNDKKNKLKILLGLEDDNSCISQFLKILDEKKNKSDSLTAKDVHALISHFQNYYSKGKKVKHIASFYDWYRELNRNLF